MYRKKKKTEFGWKIIKRKNVNTMKWKIVRCGRLIFCFVIVNNCKPGKSKRGKNRNTDLTWNMIIIGNVNNRKPKMRTGYFYYINIIQESRSCTNNYT